MWVRPLPWIKLKLINRNILAQRLSISIIARGKRFTENAAARRRVFTRSEREHIAIKSRSYHGRDMHDFPIIFCRIWYDTAYIGQSFVCTPNPPINLVTDFFLICDRISLSFFTKIITWLRPTIVLVLIAPTGFFGAVTEFQFNHEWGKAPPKITNRPTNSYIVLNIFDK